MCLDYQYLSSHQFFSPTPTKVQKLLLLLDITSTRIEPILQPASMGELRIEIRGHRKLPLSPSSTILIASTSKILNILPNHQEFCPHIFSLSINPHCTLSPLIYFFLQRLSLRWNHPAVQSCTIFTHSRKLNLNILRRIKTCSITPNDHPLFFSWGVIQTICQVTVIIMIFSFLPH